MKRLGKDEAKLLAMEIVATAQGGADYIPTISAVEYCISKVLSIPLTAVSVGIVELEIGGNQTTIIKINMVSTLWSPTVVVNYIDGSMEEGVGKLALWLYKITQDDLTHSEIKYYYDDDDAIEDYILLED